jgi:hypothetical protein
VDAGLVLSEDSTLTATISRPNRKSCVSCSHPGGAGWGDTQADARKLEAQAAAKAEWEQQKAEDAAAGELGRDAVADSAAADETSEDVYVPPRLPRGCVLPAVQRWETESSGAFAGVPLRVAPLLARGRHLGWRACPHA